jgi:hypothetical protein
MSQRRYFPVLLVALAMALPGCAWMRNVVGVRPAPVVCVLPPNASKEEVVAYLNANTAKVGAWKTDSATISIRGEGRIPISVGASLYVEAPRNFRLKAHSLAGDEADLGSNSEQFWFWNKRNEEKHVFLANHDEPPEKMRRVPIPFQPDWIIEALGVISIDPHEVTMQPGQPGSNTILLVADKVSPQGLRIRKVTVVDTCRGVIRQHAVYDAQSRLIAQAVLSDHRLDGKSQAMLPRQIALNWPAAQLGMTMTLSQIEVNPGRIPSQIWQVPNIAGYSVFDMAQ